MNELFGISMTTIMWVLVVLFAISVASVAVIWLSNRIMFRMGLRNIPRRGAQTLLVVLGLMLATLIITAAFATGDSMDYSIKKTATDLLGRHDMFLYPQGATVDGQGAGSGQYVSDRFVPALDTAFRDDPDIRSFQPYLVERLPVLNERTKLTEPSIQVTGLNATRTEGIGGLPLSGSGKADLGALGDNGVYVSAKLADKIDAKKGDTLTLYSQDTTWKVTVLGIADDQMLSGVSNVGDANEAGGMAMAASALQRITGRQGQINAVGVVLKGDEATSYKRSDTVAKRFDAFFKSDAGQGQIGLGTLDVKVEESKADAVKFAELFGNLFTTFFLVLGLFSIAAGIMLIFMIFVMLAAERKTEMGMARAVGAQRANIVQSFVSEGMAYNLMAGLVGAALGVGAAFGIVVGGARLVASELDFFSPHVTVRTLVISYCLGTVITFLTVVISCLRISQINIVSAIRGTDEVRRRESKRRTNWTWVIVGAITLVLGVAPNVSQPLFALVWGLAGLLLLAAVVGLVLRVALKRRMVWVSWAAWIGFGLILPIVPVYLLLRRGIGLPWAWIFGPVGLLLGVAMIALGKASEQQFPFSLGVSLIPLSIAALAAYYHASKRVTWTVVGAILALYWLMPFSVLERITGKLNGNIEMFVLSGIMIVTAFTLLIVFNARLLTALFERTGSRAYLVPVVLLGGVVLAAATGRAIGDAGGGLGQLFFLLAGLLLLLAAVSFASVRFPRIAPAMKMGVAYPLANRFRTGMTIAMFSLIVFSLTVMSVLNANFGAAFASDDARGGWDVVADTNRNNPVPDLRAALAAAPKDENTLDRARIRSIGQVTGLAGSQEVRQQGVEKWSNYLVRSADDAFWAAMTTKMEMRANGYGNDEDVINAVRTTPGLAIIDALALPSDNFGDSQFDWKVKGVKLGDKTFDTFGVEMRDPVSGKSSVVTVIGVISQKVPSRVMVGMYTNEQTYTPVYGRPDYVRDYINLTPGTDAEKAAKGIKAALVTKGVQAFSVKKEIDTQQAQGQGFSRIFQGFMALGLFVGIAALGVIAFRSVVERRQQIGMLRAIGYQRGTVAATFLLESSFVAIMGILSGIVGATILSRNLFDSDAFNSSPGTGFFIPWTEILIFVGAAYLFSLLLTWWPSRGASRVPIAEALRYE